MMSADINKCRRLVTGMPGAEKRDILHFRNTSAQNITGERNKPAKQERAFSAEFEKHKMPGSIRTMEVGARPDGRLLDGPLWDKA